mgnify:CR=1 FL=1
MLPYAVASFSMTNRSFCRIYKHPLRRLVIYRTQDFVNVIHRAEPDGIDVLFDVRI